MRGYTADICPRILSVPKSEQFSESEALGKLWAGGTDNVQGQISEKAARWKTRGRGPGVWKTRRLVENTGVENTGCEKHGVWWKTRGLLENTGSKCKTQRNHYFAQLLSLNFVMSNCNENQSAWNAFFGQKSELNISRERKPFKCQRAMQWFSHAWGVWFNISQWFA